MRLLGAFEVATINKAIFRNMLFYCVGAPVHRDATIKEAVKYFFTNVIRQISYVLIAIAEFSFLINNTFV